MNANSLRGFARVFHRFEDAPALKGLKDIAKEHYHAAPNTKLQLLEFQGVWDLVDTLRDRGLVGRRLIKEGDVITVYPEERSGFDITSYIIISGKKGALIARIEKETGFQAHPAPDGLYFIALPEGFEILTEVESCIM